MGASSSGLVGVIGLVLLFVVYKVVAPAPPEYEYVTAEADRGEVVRIVSASGKLRALNTFKVGSEVSGQVTAVYVDFNTPVRAGQVLAVIDGTRPRARVAQTGAQVGSRRPGSHRPRPRSPAPAPMSKYRSANMRAASSSPSAAFISKGQIDQAQNSPVDRAGGR
jgi:HlyD family secretion protein